MYSEPFLSDIDTKYQEITSIKVQLSRKLYDLSREFKEERAREYLTHGVMRRISLLAQCIENIFLLFPLEQTQLLSKDKLHDVDINLHAFFANISGVLDDLAWVVVYEKQLDIRPIYVSLFSNEISHCLPEELKGFVTSERFNQWHKTYCKSYRDALVHRIPLFVPPAVLTSDEAKEYKRLEEKMLEIDFSEECIEKYEELKSEQRMLGRLCFSFSQSLEEDANPIYFHAQIVTDFKLLEEIIDIFCDSFFNQ